MKTTVEQILHRKQRVVFYWLSAAIIVWHMLRETQTNEVLALFLEEGTKEQGLGKYCLFSNTWESCNLSTKPGGRWRRKENYF